MTSKSLLVPLLGIFVIPLGQELILVKISIQVVMRGTSRDRRPSTASGNKSQMSLNQATVPTTFLSPINWLVFIPPAPGQALCCSQWKQYRSVKKSRVKGVDMYQSSVKLGFKKCFQGRWSDVCEAGVRFLLIIIWEMLCMIPFFFS